MPITHEKISPIKQVVINFLTDKLDEDNDNSNYQIIIDKIKGKFNALINNQTSGTLIDILKSLITHRIELLPSASETTANKDPHAVFRDALFSVYCYLWRIIRANAKKKVKACSSIMSTRETIIKNYMEKCITLLPGSFSKIELNDFRALALALAFRTEESIPLLAAIPLIATELPRLLISENENIIEGTNEIKADVIILLKYKPTGSFELTSCKARVFHHDNSAATSSTPSAASKGPSLK